MAKTLQARIIEVLQNNPGLTLRELSQVLEIDMNKLRQIIYRLRTQGYIEKIGNTYIVTDKAVRYLNYIEKKKRDKHAEIEVSTQITSVEQDVEIKNEKSEISPKTLQYYDIQQVLSDLLARLNEVENRVSLLESQLRDLEKAFISSQRKRQEKPPALEPPVMSYNEAISKYGPIVDRLVIENKLIKIGSLVVDHSFYSDFKNKFPIKLADIDKLNTYEKQLLEEMRKEALVVFHAGREYRLVA